LGTEMADYIYILAELHTDKPVGYIWFQTQAAPNGFLFLEIKAFGVGAKFRGDGIASQFLSDFLHLFAKHPLEARCFSSSSQMADMLKRRGFTLDTVLPSGTQVLIRRPLL
ncbi:N-acetyltransferase, partial [Enterobacter roggenkampii]